MRTVRPVRLLTVEGPSTSADFAVAADVYIHDLAVLLADMLGEQGDAWHLTTHDGRPLQVTGRLVSTEIRDGDTVLLRPGAVTRLSPPPAAAPSPSPTTPASEES